MRQFYAALFAITLIGGAAVAQESTFRYASDPFDTEKRSEVTSTEDVVDAAAGDFEASFESGAKSEDISLVQKKAMFRAEQRQLRIESRRWYGHSQSRPIVLANPYMTSYTPLWIGHSWRPVRNWRSPFWY